MAGKKNNNIKSWVKVLIGFFSLIFIISLVIVYSIYSFLSGRSDSDKPQAGNIVRNKDSLKLNKDIDFLKAIVPETDTVCKVIRMSSRASMDVPFEFDTEAGKTYRRTFQGRRINIAITGVDSRLGSSYRHADANHVLSILIDSGKIEMTAVPRDTEADAGFPDTTTFNILSNVRAAKGREAYLAEMAKIACLDRIHYHVEFGFSQAMGILEWLGYSESASTLQVLRSRRGLGGDDFQRVYNQAQFIRQMMLSKFDKFEGFFGELFIRGGLGLVETNLSTSKVQEIFRSLKKAGFPRSEEDISIRVRPTLKIKFKKYDFTDQATVQSLMAKIESFNTNHGLSDSIKHKSAYDILTPVLDKAAADTAERPARSITKLKTYFRQRAWFQVRDKAQRDSVRERFRAILTKAYIKRNKPEKAEQVNRIIKNEIEMFNPPPKPSPAIDTAAFLLRDSTLITNNAETL